MSMIRLSSEDEKSATVSVSVSFSCVLEEGLRCRTGYSGEVGWEFVAREGTDWGVGRRGEKGLPGWGILG